MIRGTPAVEFDVPGDRRWRHCSIEHCPRGAVAERGEDVNAAGMGQQQQGTVTDPNTSAQVALNGLSRRSR